jgi:hypothetical protein
MPTLVQISALGRVIQNGVNFVPISILIQQD